MREADHVANLAQLGELLGSDVMPGLAQPHGRVGWRVTSRDRLPVVGAVQQVLRLGAAMGLGQADLAAFIDIVRPRRDGVTATR